MTLPLVPQQRQPMCHVTTLVHRSAVPISHPLDNALDRAIRVRIGLLEVLIQVRIAADGHLALKTK
jgi:hypothetical protein